MTLVTQSQTAPSELRQHWPAVLACFATATFAWGFGFYGQSVYLAELQRLRGWSASTIAGASTLFYLAGALALVRVHAALARFGPRPVLAGGVVLLGLGASAFASSASPWQLYAAALLMALGWAGSSTAAISGALLPLYDRQRGLAISLALNGASAAGFTVAPTLILLSSWHGLGRAVPQAACLLLLVVLPLIAVGFRTAPTARASDVPTPATGGSARAAPGTAAEVLRLRQFWTTGGPFALVLMAQVGFVVHLAAFLQPSLGAAGTAGALSGVAASAMLGRLALGLVIDRLDQRRASAASFASQAVALGLMLAVPEPTALYAGCVLFGLSVGNVITLPALIIQREFAARSFGLVLGLSTALAQVTFACGPALLGTIRDAAGSYAPALGLCIALQTVASVLILMGRRRR